MAITSFLDTQPRAVYSQKLQSLQPQVRRLLEPMFNEYYNRYLGELDKNPYLNFGQFLGSIDFDSEFQGFSPQLRRDYPSKYSPPGRWLNY